MDGNHSKEERLQVLRKFSRKMADSCYGKEVREEIIKSGITRYYRLLLQEIAGERRLNRSGQEMRENRKLKNFRNITGFAPRGEEPVLLRSRITRKEESTKKEGNTRTGRKEGQWKEVRQKERDREGPRGQERKKPR